ncbi:TPA: hypothetical protein L9L30_004623 [Klebsiella quasipneumoniae subsp. quasipneumoniae]|nr:hypothetical protein [Klebsiella quasipneumoniae subsp. quasipneumoniae]
MINKVNMSAGAACISIIFFPFISLAEESNSTLPQNITIICSPGYSYNQQLQSPQLNKLNDIKGLEEQEIKEFGLFDKGGIGAIIGSGGIIDPGKLDPGRILDPGGILNRGGGSSGGGPRLPSWSDIVKTVNTGGAVEGIISITNVVVGETNRQVTIVQTGINDTIKTAVKATNDIAATYEKAWKDVDSQAKRSFQDITDAGTAIAHFAGNEINSQYTLLQKAENQLRQGKILDAIWSTSLAKMQGTEDNFFKATQESKIIDMAATSAASFYGGPAAAAAMAAWKTLRTTGDINAAFRAGLLAAVQQQGGTIVNGMPTTTITEVVKKAAIAGAAGGIAVAAAGGDEQSITDAFLRTSGNVLIQDAQDSMKNIVKANPKLSTTGEVVGCISARNVNCIADIPYVKDSAGKLTDQIPPELGKIKENIDKVTGKWTSVKTQIERNTDEIFTSIPKIPGLEAIPIANNSAIITWTLGQQDEIKNGIPTVLITNIGDSTPLLNYKTTYIQMEK